MRHFVAIALAALIAAPQDEGTGPTGRTLIDAFVRARLKDLNLPQVGPADDAEFLRRASLDITGAIPTMEQVQKFLTDPAADKRAKLVDELLASEKYADHMATVWSGLLVGYGDGGQGGLARLMVHRSMKTLFTKNVPFDEFARQVITAEGTLPVGRGMAQGMMKDDEELPQGVNGLVGFFVATQRTAQREMPQALAGKFSRVFLGTQIQCAQCHDHPFDKWTQEDFYGMAAFFTQVTVRREDKKDAKDKEYSFVVADREMGRRGAQGLMIPDSKNKTPIKPSFLVTAGKPQSGEEFRTAFARLLTSRENAQFARSFVNRTWGRFMGRGFVNPVDNFDAKNAPTHPDLLDALSKTFTEHAYDVKWLIREIVMSDTYQRTSRSKKRDTEMEKYCAVASVRALTPEQIMNSLLTAASAGGDPQGAFRPRELLGVFRDFRYAFGDDEGAEVVDFQGTIPAALVMMNSPVVQRATMGTARGGGGRLAQIVSLYKNPKDQVTAMFAAALSRGPTVAELNRYMPIAAKGPQGAEDVFWALLNSSEFLFNK